MATNNIRIDQLHLRVPGLSREHAGHLGAAVAQQLASQLPAAMRSRHLGALRLRLTIPRDTPRQRLGSIIAAGIVKQLI